MIYDNLIINEKIWSQLNAMVENRKLPHAMLFHGPHGTGKEAHAIELASLLNYKTKADLEKIKIFQHPNINLITPLIKDKAIKKNSNALDALSSKSLEFYIDLKKQKMLNPYKKIVFQKTSTILINSIRDIKKNIHYNNDGRYTVYLIFDAEKLCYPRNESGNALLKVLEEPPPNTIFILVTSYKDKILDTILSRCCDFHFKKLHPKEINNFLKTNNYETENPKLLIKLCNGDLNLIIEMIEQKIDVKKIIKQAKLFISCLLNNKQYQEYCHFMESLFKKNKLEFEIYIKIIIIILNDLNKINNDYDNCIILDKQIDTKKINYNQTIEVVEKYYNQFNQNLNPSIGFFAMSIEMKQTIMKNNLE